MRVWTLFLARLRRRVPVAASLLLLVVVVERKAEDGKRLVAVMMARPWGVRVTNACRWILEWNEGESR